MSIEGRNGLKSAEELADARDREIIERVRRGVTSAVEARLEKRRARVAATQEKVSIERVEFVGESMARVFLSDGRELVGLTSVNADLDEPFSLTRFTISGQMAERGKGGGT